MVFGFLAKVAAAVAPKLLEAAMTKALESRVAKLESKVKCLTVIALISAGIAIAALVLALIR